jgi:hypothetical protein
MIQRIAQITLKLKQTMKNLFASIGKWAKTAFGKLLSELKDISKVSVTVVGKIKSVVESELFDTTTDIMKLIIPGQVDDVIIDQIKFKLPIILKKITVASGIVIESENNNELIAEFIKHLKTLHPEGRKAFWVTLAAELNIALADGKISFSEGVILSQLVYTELKNNKK